jgi:hypothetical protein
VQIEEASDLLIASFRELNLLKAVMATLVPTLALRAASARALLSAIYFYLKDTPKYRKTKFDINFKLKLWRRSVRITD